MTAKQAAKQKLLYDKLTAGLKVRESEYPVWQRKAGKDWMWAPSDESRDEHQFRREYETAMRAIHGQDWEPNPAAVEWDAYRALERGEHCDICGRPGPKACDPCRRWSEARFDAKRIRKAVAA